MGKVIPVHFWALMLNSKFLLQFKFLNEDLSWLADISKVLQDHHAIDLMCTRQPRYGVHYPNGRVSC